MVGSQASAEDVWFCEGKYLSMWDWGEEDNKMTVYNPSNFKFQVQRNKVNEHLFGPGNKVKESLFGQELETIIYSPQTGNMSAYGETCMITMRDGNLNMAVLSLTTIATITAKCDKF